MTRYEVKYTQYTSKRQPRWAVQVTNPATQNVISEPGFKTREAAQEWANKVQANGNAVLDMQH